MSFDMKGYPNANLLTSPGDLAEALKGERPPLVLDLRAPEDFATGHIPGAVHLDLWGVSLIDTDPAPLRAFMWMIDHLFNLRGVDASTPVVVYDHQSGMRAARAFWFLEYFGHPRVQMLDGGFTAWARAGLPVTTRGAAAWQEHLDRHAAGRRSSRRGGTSRIASASPDTVLLDTRTDGEYHGTTVRAKRGGAIPGAVHIEWTRNLTPEGDVQARRRAARDVRSRRRDARQGGRDILPGRLPRRARLPGPAAPRLPSRPQLHGLLEGVGGQRGPAGRERVVLKVLKVLGC